jgi:exodeoxyribonuclease VIII
MHLMIDLEGLATGPDTTILTIAAQAFDPLGNGWYDQQYYARVTLESQENRRIEQGTLDWWATQPAPARDEAFAEEGRIPLDQALDGLGKLIWHSKRIWAQGPTYDMNILEHAYKSYNKPIPWQYYSVRDSRTIFGLWPELPKPPTSHHALEDCRRQIGLLQKTLKYLNVKDLA